LENCDEYFVQKIAEVRHIAGSVEKQVVEEAAEMLELIPEASVATPESTSIAEVSDFQPTLYQTNSST